MDARKWSPLFPSPDERRSQSSASSRAGSVTVATMVRSTGRMDGVNPAMRTRRPLWCTSLDAGQRAGCRSQSFGCVIPSSANLFEVPAPALERPDRCVEIPYRLRNLSPRREVGRRAPAVLPACPTRLRLAGLRLGPRTGAPVHPAATVRHRRAGAFEPAPGARAASSGLPSRDQGRPPVGRIGWLAAIRHPAPLDLFAGHPHPLRAAGRR